MKSCRTAEQMKAVSQNLGHEHIGTTLTSYGTLDQFRVKDVIHDLDFRADQDSELSPEEVKALEKILKRAKQSY